MMNKQTFYREFLAKFIKRFLIFGLPGCVVFVLFWYLMNGYAIWGSILDFCATPISFLIDIDYESGRLERAGLVQAVTVYGKDLEIVYKVNQLNSNLVVLVMIFCTWPHKSWGDALKLVPLLFVFTVGYQLFSVWILSYESALGPQMADRLKVFWEPNAWYETIRHIAAFDKFILRYYAAFPIFGAGIVVRYFLTKPKAGTKKGK